MRVVRSIIVVVGAIVLTSVGTLALEPEIVPQSLLGSVWWSEPSPAESCPSDMVLVDAPQGKYCIDRFEASLHKKCPLQTPSSLQDSQINLVAPGCVPVSDGQNVPWVFVTQAQAQEACMKAGKRLSTNDEWYRAARGTSESACHIQAQTSHQGETAPECISFVGARHMVGNVWEWVEATVVNGVFEGKSLPLSGYVTEVDEMGIPLQSSGVAPSDVLTNDKIWSDPTKTTAVMRGGYFGSNNSAGVYAFHAASAPAFAGVAVGFRCVTSL